MSLGVERDARAALRARAHPLRLRMLSLLTGAPMSAAELGRELEVSQALASYHLRFLVDAGLLESAGETVNRGGRERRYRYRAGSEPTTSSAEVADGHELMLVAAIEELRRRHVERDVEGGGITIDAELWVSPEDWDEFRNTVRDAGVRLHDRAVRPREPGSRPVNVSVFAFPMRADRPAEPRS